MKDDFDLEEYQILLADIGEPHLYREGAYNCLCGFDPERALNLSVRNLKEQLEEYGSIESVDLCDQCVRSLRIRARDAFEEGHYYEVGDEDSMVLLAHNIVQSRQDSHINFTDQHGHIIKYTLPDLFEFWLTDQVKHLGDDYGE